MPANRHALSAENQSHLTVPILLKLRGLSACALPTAAPSRGSCDDTPGPACPPETGPLRARISQKPMELRRGEAAAFTPKVRSARQFCPRTPPLHGSAAPPRYSSTALREAAVSLFPPPVKIRGIILVPFSDHGYFWGLSTPDTTQP